MRKEGGGLLHFSPPAWAGFAAPSKAWEAAKLGIDLGLLLSSWANMDNSLSFAEPSISHLPDASILPLRMLCSSPGATVTN